MTVSDTAPLARPAPDRAAALPPAILALLAAFAVGVVAQGAYYLPGRLALTALTALAVLLTLPVRSWSGQQDGRPWSRAQDGRPWSRADFWPVPAACAALGLWALVRAVGAGGYPAAAGEVATLGCLAAVPVVLRRTGPDAREHLARLLIGVGALAAGTAWLGVAWRLPRFAVLVDEQLWRGAGTLTYPNAAAALFVPLALLAIAMPGATPRAPAHTLARYLLLAGAGATLSRAGLIALAVGLVVLTVVAGPGVTIRRATAPLAGAAVAVAALAPSFPVRAHAHPALAVAGLLAGAAIALVPGYLPRGVRGATGGAALLLCGAVAWSRFGTDTAHDILRSRGNVESSGRSDALHATIHLVAARPLTGAGVGQARFLWSTPDGNAQIAQYVHDEYLQTLVDLGAIGLVALLALIAAIAVTIHRGRAFPHRPGIRAGAIAALAAFAVHSGFDFLWHIAVLPLAAGLLLGLAAPTTGGTITHSEGEPQ